MGIFDDHPPAYFTANCDQRLKDAWLDEGGKLAQPQSFSLRPGSFECKNIKSEFSHTASTPHPDRQFYSPRLRRSLAISSPLKDSSPSTSFLPSASPLDVQLVYLEPSELNDPGKPTEHEVVVSGGPSDSRKRLEASMRLDPAASTVKKEEDDVDSALTAGLNEGDTFPNTRGLEVLETTLNQVKHEEQTLYLNPLRYAKDDGTLYHTARPPSRSTPQTFRGPSTVEFDCSNRSSPGEVPSRPPPSNYSDVKQEWTVSLLVFCSAEDEGLGRKDDEILGFPTKTKGSTLFIFSEDWIEECIRSSKRGAMEQSPKVDLRGHLSQVPKAYRDHHTVAIGRRSVLATPRHPSSLRQPTWITGERKDQLSDSYPFPSSPAGFQEEQTVHTTQYRSHKQPLPISPMRTPSSKVPPEFEWSSEYDCWQREAERGRRVKRVEDAGGDFRKNGNGDLGDLGCEIQRRSVVGSKRPAGGSPRLRHTKNGSNSMGSGRFAVRNTTNRLDGTLSKPLSEPSRRIVRKLFGGILGEHDTPPQEMVWRPQVEIHEDLSAKSAVRKIKYMIQVQDGNGLRRIEVVMPDSMKKAMRNDEIRREMSQSMR